MRAAVQLGCLTGRPHPGRDAVPHMLLAELFEKPCARQLLPGLVEHPHQAQVDIAVTKLLQ